MALICAVQAAEPVAASSQANPAPKLILNPTSFAQLLLMRSLEIEYSRYSKEVADRIFAAESALYESVMYGNFRKTDTQRQRTTEEKAITMLSTNDYVLYENAKSAETGIKQLFPTGAEVTIGTRLVERSNNIMAKYNTNLEVTSALVVTVKQPLLKGAGVTVTEADKRVAEYESLITAWQSRQQLLKVLSEGLSLFWQAQMAHQVAGLRLEMYRTAEALVADARQRVLAGKLPPRSIQELDRFRLTRQADWVRYQQNSNELQSRILTQLNYRRVDIAGIELQPHSVEPLAQMAPADPVDYALDSWAPFQVSRLKVAQARTRLAYAANQRLPSLDLQYSYSSNGLAESFRPSASLVKQNTYPDWWVGFNFEMPLSGNEKAKAQFQAQNLRVAQAETELSAVRLSLENDLFSKRSEIESTRKEVEIFQADVQLKTALRKSEQLRFEAGLGLVSGLIQSDQDLLEARIRLLDANGRLQIARLALSLADGTLLETHHVEAVLPPTTLQ
ncbi:TolC Outer membrane protein [Burkholderiaceae bacterium]